MKNVWVVTGLELGWNCVVGVFDMDKVSLVDLSIAYPIGEYAIHEQWVQDTVDDC